MRRERAQSDSHSSLLFNGHDMRLGTISLVFQFCTYQMWIMISKYPIGLSNNQLKQGMWNVLGEYKYIIWMIITVSNILQINDISVNRETTNAKQKISKDYHLFFDSRLIPTYSLKALIVTEFTNLKEKKDCHTWS